MTGRRNRAHAAAKFGKRCLPNWFFPLRPRRYFRAAEIRYLPRKRGKFFLPWLYYGSKNGIEKIFYFSKQPQNSVRTSFGCRSVCLREIFATPHPPLARSHFSNGRKLTNAGKGFARLFQKSCGYAQTKQLIFVEVFATLFLKKRENFIMTAQIGAVSERFLPTERLIRSDQCFHSHVLIQLLI